ncbi:GNAT family N-acetyltransferase [Lichenicoccus sp.]|uniref:GNAT family N-acetyltransferase n=1 Tax=Lichenicoccus sp. TaxID=2781899 RepID=UPI003D11CACB
MTIDARRQVSRDLVTAWVRGWTVARKVAPPVEIPGGLRVDVRSPKERVRNVLFALEPARIRELVATETEPPVSIKVCAEVAELAPYLSDRWALHEQRYLMTLPLTATQDRRELPNGYNLSLRQNGSVVTASIRAGFGHPAAIGRVAITVPFAIIDDVETSQAHRRRGLGTLIMTALNRVAAEAGAATGLLVATPDGHALYASVGWQVHTPYASAYLA